MRADDQGGSATQKWGITTTSGATGKLGNNALTGNATAPLNDLASLLPDITGARDETEGALKDLLAELATLGLITDSTTAS